VSQVDLRKEMHQDEPAGCGSCLGALLMASFTYVALNGDRLDWAGTGTRIFLAYLLGMLLGKVSAQLWQKEFRGPNFALGGLVVSAVPMLLACAAALVEGWDKYHEVMERSAPGWGRADIANYSYPSITAYLSSVLMLVLVMGWLMTALGAYRRQARGDTL
jgi:hypothetical protein